MRAFSHSLQTIHFFNVAGMDYSGPVARRTRSRREAQLLLEYNEKFRNKKVKIGGSESVSEREFFCKVDESVKDCVDSVVRDVSEKSRANVRGKDKGKSVVSGGKANTMPIMVDVSDDGDGDSSEGDDGCHDDESVKDSVDSLVHNVFEKSNANVRGKYKGKSIVSGGKDNTTPIMLEVSDDGDGNEGDDGSDDEDVVYRGEKNDVGAEGNDVICLDDEDVLGESNSLFPNNADENDGSNSGVALHEGSSDDDEDHDVGSEEYSDELKTVSSEEDNDDPDDEDYVSSEEEVDEEEDTKSSSEEEEVENYVGGSDSINRGGDEGKKSKRVEILSPSSKDEVDDEEDDSIEVAAGMSDDMGETRRVEEESNWSKLEELDALVDSDDTKGDELNKNSSVNVGRNLQPVAKRTRSHFASEVVAGMPDDMGETRRVEEESNWSKFEELDALVDSDDTKGDELNKNSSVNVGRNLQPVARRTRSHFASEVSKKKVELGTMENPLFIDLDNKDVSSRPDDNGDDDETDHRVRKKGSGRKNDGKKLYTVSKKVKGKFGKSKKKKNSMMKNQNLEEILLNSILDAKEIPLEDSLFSKSDVRIRERSESDDETFYPVKFNFGNGEPTPPKKTEFEKEMDSLWTEMDFAIAASTIGSPEPSMDAKGVEPASDIEQDQATCCAQGKHNLILDEEIGIVCKFCSFVQLEIRYIVPSFVQNPWERYRRYSKFEDDFGLCDLHFEDSGCGSRSGLASCSRAEGTVWDLVPGVKNSMYPHQREGFEFIWRNISGGIDLAKLKELSLSNSGNGCIISHAPGTGKTRLAIVFLQAYLKMYPTCRPIIVAPCNMLLTWEEEFKKWKSGISFHNLNNSVLTGKESLELRNASESLIRTVKLFSWKKGGSVLGISYTRFKLLVGGIKNGEKKKLGKMNEDIRKILIELPSLFVFDEGHIPRNEQTDVFRALSEIQTENRIILSGTPFQNNFEELFNTFYLVRPRFVEDMQSKNIRDSVSKRGRKRNEERGKWTSLTSSIGKAEDRLEDEKKLNKLRTLIAPFVHVHKGAVLQDSLPGLRQSVVVLRPFYLQKQLLEIIEGETDMVKKNNYVSLVAAHPSLFLKLSDKEEKYKDKLVDHRAELERIRLNPEVGTKMKFLMELLRLSEALNEKVLVFSDILRPLRLIIDQLEENFSWIEGREVLYMDGKQDVQQRQSTIHVFNDPSSEAKVLLASKAACCEGINLVGASRLVLLDVAWNPSRDSQAISRAYRLGQKKFVHVYRLITSGTVEEKKCSRQAKKDWLSRSVFFSADGEGNDQNLSLNAIEDKILEEMLQHHKVRYIEKIEEYAESKLIETFGLGW